MDFTFPCPCCEDFNWSNINEHVYLNVPGNRLKFPQDASGTKSLSTRLQILFNIWFPNKEEVILTSAYCKSCGFVCYFPRPDKIDLQAKYQYLSERERIGGLTNPTRRALKLDKERERFMNSAIAGYHNVESQKVLDVGGGDGRLLRPFLKKGNHCYVVDFNPEPYTDVQRIGCTLDDIPGETLFDILICSHVLEHVSDPGHFLNQLRSRLSPGGVIYIEVPLEVWQGIHISKDPVTHINFFTVNSLKNALLLNGLQPLSIKSKFSSYNGTYKRVAWTVACAAEMKTSLSNVNSLETQALIQPDFLRKIKRSFENFWLVWFLNLPLTIRKKMGFLGKALNQSTIKQNVIFSRLYSK